MTMSQLRINRFPNCEFTPEKVKFLSWDDALTSRYARKWPHLRPYLCRSCGYFHLTSKPLPDQKEAS